MDTETPLIRQYLEIKQNHPDTLLLFRVGDFYEMFFEDAVAASKILNIALTSRDKTRENPVPLCGIPYHALGNYLGKLISAGCRVALCEQMEDPRMAKGIVRREVVRIISPGAVIETELLDGTTNNYFAALVHFEKTAGLAWLDVSTGDFNLQEISGPEPLARALGELNRLSPRELLLPDTLASLPETEALFSGQKWKIGSQPASHFQLDRARTALLRHFKVETLAGFGCENLTAGISAAGGLFSYLANLLKTPMAHVQKITPVRSGDFLAMDSATIRNLELLANSHDGTREHTLLWILDRTETPMGRREIRKWISRPLIAKEAIEGRLESVEFLVNHFELLQRVRKSLGEIQDLERTISRITLKGCSGRDFIHLKNSVPPLKTIEKTLQIPLPGLLSGVMKHWDSLDDLHRMIDRAICDDPPFSIREGSLIKGGFSPELDNLKSIGGNIKNTLADMELRERARTGIDSLKIRYNQVAGYYIEISKLKSGQVPQDYQRKQTLTSAERFTVPELTDLEIQVRESEQAIKTLEESLFEEIRSRISDESRRVLAIAGLAAQLDVLASFAEVSRQNRYVRPSIETGEGLKIIEGRHPVIEKLLPPGKFISNDTFLNDENRMMIITGPNMAGKSTYMRQTALIVVMAQAGCFVPALECSIGMADRLYTRIGASDFLTRGQSTFMVEMTETAEILNTATPRSLILLDEIGRGTSTYDGISIAWAVAEHILSKLGTRTLFATHYHELTGLAGSWSSAGNFNVSVKEWRDEILFLRKISPGTADRSYGIQVARLAGIPQGVISRAREILSGLEAEALDPDRLSAGNGGQNPENLEKRGNQADLFGASGEKNHSRALSILEKADPLHLTPLQALNMIYELKELMNAPPTGNPSEPAPP